MLSDWPGGRTDHVFFRLADAWEESGAGLLLRKLRLKFDGASKLLLKGFVLLYSIKIFSSISERALHGARESKVQFEFAEVKIGI